MEKLSFIKKFDYSFSRTHEKELEKQSIGSTLLYLVICVLVFTILMSVLIVIKYKQLDFNELVFLVDYYIAEPISYIFDFILCTSVIYWAMTKFIVWFGKDKLKKELANDEDIELNNDDIEQLEEKNKELTTKDIKYKSFFNISTYYSTVPMILLFMLYIINFYDLIPSTWSFFILCVIFLIDAIYCSNDIMKDAFYSIRHKEK